VKTHARWRALTAVAVMLALLATACGGSGDDDATEPEASADPGRSEVIGDEGEPVDGGTMVIAVDSESSGWNPAIDRWATAGAMVGSSILEPLATLDGDGMAQPWLATGWTPNDTYDSWTIDLREGVTFHDGSPFDAEAVKANLDFIVVAPLSSVAMKPLFDEVVVVDDDTVEVRLTTRWAAFPSSFLAGQSAFMRAPASMLTDDQGSSRPVGTGPFVFDSWRQDVSFEVTANPDYWVEGQPHLDGIEYRVITDPTSRAASLRSGEIDLAIIGLPDDAKRLEADFTVLRNWDVEPASLLANVRPTVGGRPNPMSNLHARLAMAHAIDRDTIAATIGEGVRVPTSPFSPDSPWGQPSELNGYPDYDSEAARRELDAYRAETGQDTLRVTILGPSNPISQSALQLVQQQLAAVGVEARIEGRESASLISTVVGASYEVALFSHYSSPDPDQNHYFWSASTVSEEGGISINFTGFTNETTEAALRQGRENEDVDVRRDAYSTLVEEFNANAVNMWLFYAPHSLVAAPEVRGLAAIGDVRFANFQPKTWLGGLWLSPS
jgi:peptide/nickel transport system substrate-binding protein